MCHCSFLSVCLGWKGGLWHSANRDPFSTYLCSRKQEDVWKSKWQNGKACVARDEHVLGSFLFSEEWQELFEIRKIKHDESAAENTVKITDCSMNSDCVNSSNIHVNTQVAKFDSVTVKMFLMEIFNGGGRRVVGVEVFPSTDFKRKKTFFSWKIKQKIRKQNEEMCKPNFSV